MGCYIGASTKIIDRETGEIMSGRVPAYSVVVPGTLAGQAAAGRPAGAEPLLLRHRQAGRRAHAREDLDQRAVAHVSARLGNATLDPVELTAALIRCPSVTPHEGGALVLLEERLARLGFACHRLKFSAKDTPDVDNLYARIGTSGPNFCFAGHTDVVPPRQCQGLDGRSFGGALVDGELYGRGATDMKGAIAAFAAAAARFLAARGAEFGGSISLLITGDEEGAAINGTRKVLDWLAARGERLDACIVGEPTNPRAPRRHDQDRPARQPQRPARRCAAPRAIPPIPTSPTTPRTSIVRMLSALLSAAARRGHAAISSPPRSRSRASTSATRRTT